MGVLGGRSGQGTRTWANHRSAGDSNERLISSDVSSVPRDCGDAAMMIFFFVSSVDDICDLPPTQSSGFVW